MNLTPARVGGDVEVAGELSPPFKSLRVVWLSIWIASRYGLWKLEIQRFINVGELTVYIIT